MKKNLILCLLLALAMMVSLTACQVEIPGIGTVNINDGSTGGNAGGDHTIHTGSDNDESLALLRKSMARLPHRALPPGGGQRRQPVLCGAP